MRRPGLVLFFAVSLLNAATVVDRVAVIVGRRVVKTSDISRDLRASQFMNQQPLDLSPAASRKSAERLIDQELISQEIASGGYSQPAEGEVDTFLQQLRRDRFRASEAQMRASLLHYGLSEDVLRQYLRWQLTVLRFIDQRFRPGVLVTDEDIRAYYDAHRAELQRASPKDNSLETLTPKIREIITGERVNQGFEEWLNQARHRNRIEYREAALRGGVSP